MNFNRYDAKMQAKASLRGAYPHPMLVTLVFVLATSVLSWIINFFVTNPFTAMLDYLSYGTDPALVFAHFFGGGRMVLFIFLSTLLTLYGWVMGFGYTSYGLRLARGEQPTYRNLLDGFAVAGRVILTSLLTGLFVLLWELVVLIPMTLVMIPLIMWGSDGGVVVVIYLAMILGLAAFILSVTYRYRLTFFLLLDHPELGALEAITRSKLAMRGHKWEMFVLDISFLGWHLLTPLTLGILGLWVIPYHTAAQANFYDAVTGGLPPMQQPGPQTDL